MKILLVTRYYPNKTQKGAGPLLITRNLYEALKRKNCQVDLLSPKQFQTRNKLLITLNIVKVIIKNNKQYDIINIDTSSNILPLFFLPFFGKKLCPIILTVHGLPEIERTYNTIKQIIHEILSDIRLNFYHNIIVVSELLRKEITRRYDCSDKNIKVIHNGINDIFLKTNINKVEKKTSNKLQLLLIGGLQERKGIYFLIDALKEINDINWRLTIIGRTFTLKHKSKFWTLIEKNRLRNKITYIEWIEQEKLIYYYDNCDIVVAPSRFDTFNVAVLEGMARGKPVITTYTSGVSELIENYKDGLVINYNDKKALINAIRFLNNNRKRIEIGNNARIKAEKYSWDNVAEVYIKTYQSFLEEFHSQRQNK